MHHRRPLVLDLLIRRGRSAPRNAPAVDSPEAAVTFQKGTSGPRQSVGERFRYEASAGGSSAPSSNGQGVPSARVQRDWLRNAQAQGVRTADQPSVGAVAVYRPGGLYSDYGHVAVVTAVAPSSYTVSEMNAPRWGQVSTRMVPWPDPGVQGFIPLREVDGG